MLATVRQLWFHSFHERIVTPHPCERACIPPVQQLEKLRRLVYALANLLFYLQLFDEKRFCGAVGQHCYLITQGAQF